MEEKSEAAQEGADGRPPDVFVRFSALLLLVGGAFGVVLFLWLMVERQQPGQPLLFGVLVLLYGWSCVQGLALWHGEPQGWRWARLLFAAQIPTLSVPGFSYEYHTGLAVTALVGDQGTNLVVNVGSSAALYLAPDIAGITLGVNLVAVAVFAYLVYGRATPQEIPADAGAVPVVRTRAADLATLFRRRK